jgi:hypothetical protein
MRGASDYPAGARREWGWPNQAIQRTAIAFFSVCSGRHSAAAELVVRPPEAHRAG